MLAIRMQRTGRKGHAMFRIVVQDSHRTPTSGKLVALLGSYDPHAKTVQLKKEKASFYLEHGAQPSERVVKILVSEGVTLPKWVTKPSTDKKRTSRHPEKFQKETATAAPAEATETKVAEPDQAEATE